MEVKIYPLDRVEIDGVSVCLGMEKNAVEAEIGKAQLAGNRCYYFNAEMAIDYDGDSRVEFIEFLGGIDGSVKPFIYGVSAFDSDARVLAEILKRENGGEIDDTERGYLFAFLNISVGVYREIRPEDVLEMIEEMKADGIPTDDNADLEADRRSASHWATIGVGVAGYYRK